jgi:repressor of nif and glnA expression
VLGNLYHMAAQHADPTRPHSATALRLMGAGERGVRYSLQVLAERGLVRQVEGDQWALTPAGVDAAQRVRRET